MGICVTLPPSDIGAFLSVSVHMGFLALFAAGAFGPGLLRELGLLRDLDEFQEEAALRSGYRSYLIGGVILTAVVIARQWSTLRLGDDLIPASCVLVLLLVICSVSYSLSFWDVRRAASLVLCGFGLFWLIFVVLSHPHRTSGRADRFVREKTDRPWRSSPGGYAFFYTMGMNWL